MGTSKRAHGNTCGNKGNTKWKTLRAVMGGVTFSLKNDGVFPQKSMSDESLTDGGCYKTQERHRVEGHRQLLDKKNQKTVG